MSVTVLIGLQWGDEGKGKMSHYLAADHDVGVRFNGGPNAGHTIRFGENKIVTHLVPSTALYNKPSVLTPGVLIDRGVLTEELFHLSELGFSKSNLLIDPSCALITESFKSQDIGSGKKIDTTGRGIGPTMAAQINRTGVRIGEALSMNNNALDGWFCRTVQYIRNAIRDGKRVLCEGAQGHYLDLWHGTYPFVTSSMCTIGAVCTNAGIPPQKIDRVVGVFKAYCTRVGNGPFLTEMSNFDDKAKRIAERGKEIGATTGRPRRIGWLDLIDLREAVRFNGVTELALTKSDVLEDILTRVAFDRPNGKPHYLSYLWRKASLEDRDFRSFVNYVEEFTGVPVRYISTGPLTEETLDREKDNGTETIYNTEGKSRCNSQPYRRASF